MSKTSSEGDAVMSCPMCGADLAGEYQQLYKCGSHPGKKRKYFEARSCLTSQRDQLEAKCVEQYEQISQLVVAREKVALLVPVSECSATVEDDISAFVERLKTRCERSEAERDRYQDALKHLGKDAAEACNQRKFTSEARGWILSFRRRIDKALGRDEG